MKKLITIILLSLFSGDSFSQTNNCSEIAKRNILLENKLKSLGVDILDTITKVETFTNDITFNFLSCIGNKKNQSVTFKFNIFNKSLPNQIITIEKDHFPAPLSITADYLTELRDSEGNGYAVSEGILGSEKNIDYFNTLRNTLLTGGKPLVCSLTFFNILPTVKNINSVIIAFKMGNKVGSDGEDKEGKIVFKNIPLIWN